MKEIYLRPSLFLCEAEVWELLPLQKSCSLVPTILIGCFIACHFQSPLGITLQLKHCTWPLRSNPMHPGSVVFPRKTVRPWHFRWKPRSPAEKLFFPVGDKSWLSYIIPSLPPRQSLQEVSDRVKWREEKLGCERKRGRFLHPQQFSPCIPFVVGALAWVGVSVEACFQEVCLFADDSSAFHFRLIAHITIPQAANRPLCTGMFV